MGRITAVKLSANTRRLIREALAEDIGSGDATSRALLPPTLRARARIVAGQVGVVCGAKIAAEVFYQTDRRINVRIAKRDGQTVRNADRILEIRGPIASILTAERTALNFLQRLSGIATLASRFVRAVRGCRCRILDTRKTTPGWRELEKQAVACGGASNHRMRLDDMILIKDNHLASLREQSNPIAVAVQRARKKFPRLKIEVECDRLSQVQQAVAARADMILLDNMDPARLKAAVRIAPRRMILEASGGVTLNNVRRIAGTGVDCISIGALTHSAPALDFSMEVY